MPASPADRSTVRGQPLWLMIDQRGTPADARRLLAGARERLARSRHLLRQSDLLLARLRASGSSEPPLRRRVPTD